MSRAKGKGNIFINDVDRQDFLKTLKRGQPIYSFVFCLPWAADSSQARPCLAGCASSTQVPSIIS